MAEATDTFQNLVETFAKSAPVSNSAPITGNFGLFSDKQDEKNSYFAKIQIGKYKRPTIHDEALFEASAYIRLPLPLEMRDDTSVGYTQENLQNVGDLFNGQTSATALGLRNAEALAGGLGNTADVLSSMFGKKWNKLVTGTTGALGQALPPGLMASALSQKMGVAANPNPSVQFLGPSLRTFTFTWNFNPRTADESRAIHGTIKLLKQSALPTLTTITNSSLLDYPRMVRLNFYPWDNTGAIVDSRHGWTAESIFRFGISVMESVNVNYAPSQAPAFFKGTHSPAMITISITFREIEYLLSHHWADQGNDLYGAGISTTEEAQLERAKNETDVLIKDNKFVAAVPGEIGNEKEVYFITDTNGDGTREIVTVPRNPFDSWEYGAKKQELQAVDPATQGPFVRKKP